MISDEVWGERVLAGEQTGDHQSWFRRRGEA